MAATWTSTDQQILDAKKTALLNLMNGGAQQYTISGRAWTGFSIPELEQSIRRDEARKEMAERQGRVSSTTKFARPTGGAF